MTKESQRARGQRTNLDHFMSIVSVIIDKFDGVDSRIHPIKSLRWIIDGQAVRPMKLLRSDDDAAVGAIQK